MVYEKNIRKKHTKQRGRSEKREEPTEGIKGSPGQTCQAHFISDQLRLRKAEQSRNVAHRLIILRPFGPIF